MKQQLIRNELLGDSYLEIDHCSGLKILVMEKPAFTGAFAMFGVNYGSVDTCFRRKGEEDFTRVPEGIAHYLEHKLFESEELDAFARFAKTGASANAFTSFDRTCYLFQCADHFEENLEILLDFVQKPYFTEQTVQKEQGIIGQEIRMYQDSPDWQVLFNLLGAVYWNNPVRIDIAGTIESIAQITAPLLYDCYRTFYHLSNMVLAVAGNVTAEQVLAVADRLLKKTPGGKAEQIIPEEPDAVAKSYTEETLGVDIPKFALGFKQSHAAPLRTANEIAAANIALELIAGKTSALYQKLMQEGLINPAFGSEYFCGRGFAMPIFIGESKDPDAVRDALLLEIRRLQRQGVAQEDFEIARKRLYGLEIRGFNDVDDLAGELVEACFCSRGLFDLLQAYRTVSLPEIQCVIEAGFNTDNCSLSVIK